MRRLLENWWPQLGLAGLGMGPCQSRKVVVPQQEARGRCLLGSQEDGVDVVIIIWA